MTRFRTRTTAAWLICLGISAPAAITNAQKVIVLPTNAGAGGEAIADVAHAAVRDALALQGLQVVTWQEVVARVPASAECDDVTTCTPIAMKAIGAELAAGVVVTRGAQGAAEHARVALLDSDRRRYDGEAEVEDGDVRTATTRALLEARSFQLLGPGPWLRVEGTPEGAEVLLDDRIVGRVPYRATVIPGRHKLRVREAGYTPFEHPLDIPATDDAHIAQVVVALEPAPIAIASGSADLRAVQPEATENDGSSTWLVAPLAIGGIGLALAGVTSVRLASKLDSCSNPDNSRICTGAWKVNWVPIALEYSVSAALIGAAVVWIVVGSDDGERSSGVTARLAPGGISVAGRF